LQGGSSNFNPQGGTSSVPPSDGYQGVVNILSHSKLKDVDLLTRSQNYDNPESTEKGKKASEDQAPLHIEKPEKETVSHIPKGVYKWTMHNPNARVPPNYLIVEDLAQTPCAMSALEVLQSFPSQHAALLSSIGAIDSSSQLVMKFDATEVRPHLPYHVAFQIGVVCNNILVKRTIVDEGASTCVMSLSCWKAIGSPKLTPSPTLLIAFDG
jgi:hypothetical protein